MPDKTPLELAVQVVELGNAICLPFGCKRIAAAQAFLMACVVPLVVVVAIKIGFGK